MFGLVGVKEHLELVVGLAIVGVAAPFIAPVVLSAIIWEGLDRGFKGGFVRSGNELSGVLLGGVAPWFNRQTNDFNAQFVKRREDGYMINVLVLQGIAIPAAFLGCYVHTAAHGFSVALCWAYHVFRIGPYFMNFAYCYTLCHKEGHSTRGLYAAPYNNPLLRNVFNWWVGLFFGVMPASFAFGHSINHHRYNNGPLDVVTTADKPRDSIIHWICYLPRWTSYALNLSSTVRFMQEGSYHVALQMVWGSVYFWAWYGIWAHINPTFAAAYLLYPFLENVILLACVNWSWHAFINPSDPEDEYVGSVTIIDGPINVLNEDFHVVHHQYPGEHWTAHETRARKHWEQYVDHRATCFRKTHAFEIFGMVVSRDYHTLARKFVDLRGEKRGDAMTHQHKVALLQSRLRACWWGPRTTRAAPSR